MKANCTHCGKPIFYSGRDGVWSHEYKRWPEDNGHYCFQNVYQFTADPRSMEEIKFRKKFYETKFHLNTGKWIAVAPTTGEEMEDPFLNEYSPALMEFLYAWQEVVRLREENERLRELIDKGKRWLTY